MLIADERPEATCSPMSKYENLANQMDSVGMSYSRANEEMVYLANGLNALVHNSVS